MDTEMNESKDNRFIPMTSIANGIWQEIAKDVYGYTDQIVNLTIINKPEEHAWYLVDTGLPGSADEIKSVIEEHLADAGKPSAILLTHGHFDHVGGLIELNKGWEVPIYAHPSEFPYLTGEKAYPKPDMTVEGGLLAKISPYYPNEPIDVSPYLKELPKNLGEIGLPEWEWIHTPGHAPGHVSFFCPDKGLLLAGDAFITVKQDSFFKVLLQNEEISGPPRYLTTDWKEAKTSVQKLADLHPDIAFTGHGPLMQGKELKEGLQDLVDHFEEKAVPDYGKYIN
ncbi:MBL fold metallo-hydrolase [Virgibacillus sp. 179-BFC.A HS]|uniref:MBL fold metallo-hydrolase n=1 Tax=Tigheibacillus jepli TaxID=3035914 RepID=A0ABU5CKX0_9BACI|nr:MBL fold metallo-hydrolase [Virgibacillus sp. 179-BFC.A HS]MDY0406966.1 MBL fold metallo-hydrolase [Virgibacillus sp. 179-BFC.A HS]